MKKTFTLPAIEIIKLEMSDLVVTSGDCEICDGYNCGSTDGKTCCQGDWGH